jgi:hypothetical protein
MKNSKNSKKRGFVKIILLIAGVIGALVLLKYVYNIDVVGFLTAGRFKELLDQLYGLGAKVWNYFIGFLKNLIAKK